MTRFNKATARPKAMATGGPIKGPSVSTGRTGNNAPGFARDAKSELFLLAVSNFVGQKTFYEKAADRDTRYNTLIRTVATADPDWAMRFLPWLRETANMRTSAVTGAVEAAVAMAQAKVPGGRQLVAGSLRRADEPGEALAYFAKQFPGKQIPKPLKRGIADAVSFLYTQRNTLKYDTGSKGFRFGDVLELCHPTPASPDQADLFKYLVTRGKGRTDAVIPDSLTMLIANQALRMQARETPQVLLNSTRLAMAGMNWEDTLPLGDGKVSKKDLWESIIPSMGYMALLRNLRAFDEVGVKGDLADIIIQKLTNPEAVAKSRQLPMRFLSAYRAVPSNRWAQALETALDLTLQNVPEFGGRTLILIDTSGSMDITFSADSALRRWDAAVVFGLAMARRCADADVVSFSDTSKAFPARAGESLLKSVERWKMGGYFYAHGTATQRAVSAHFKGHDRVVILTDEQADYHGYADIAVSVPATVPVITFNLGGDRYGHAPAGSATRITIGGLSDAAFSLIPALEARAKDQWPF